MPVNLGQRVLPCLFVSDMQRALEFYTETLGFTQTGYYPIESEPIRTEVRRDGVAIVLISEVQHGNVERDQFSGVLYIFPESVDQLADELRGRVPFAWGPTKTDLGTYEFAVQDPTGYTLIFAERA